MMPSTMLRDVVVGSSAGREPETESVHNEQSSGKLDGRDGRGPQVASES